MPINKHGDFYDPEQYNGDSSMNGRFETNESKKIQEGQDWFDEVFAVKVLPIYFPEIKDFIEGFNSMEMEPGEYSVDNTTVDDGEVAVYCDVACRPQDYARLMALPYEQLEKPFKEAAGIDYACEILSNDDNPEAPIITFQITVY